MSPYLFILCMEVLGHLIEEKCREKKWTHVKASRSGIAFSHLFFADNLVLFTKANGSNCSAIRNALDEFCNISSQLMKPNPECFSPLMLLETRGNPCVIFWGFLQHLISANIWDFLFSTEGQVARTSILSLRKLSKNLLVGRPTFFLLLARQFLSRLLLLPFQLMLCNAMPSQVSFWTTLIKLIGIFCGALRSWLRRCIG